MAAEIILDVILWTVALAFLAGLWFLFVFIIRDQTGNDNKGQNYYASVCGSYRKDWRPECAAFQRNNGACLSCENPSCSEARKPASAEPAGASGIISRASGIPYTASGIPYMPGTRHPQEEVT